MTALEGPTRGPYAKSAARRQEILDAGIEVFSNNGYWNGSTRDIADKVGISHSGLLHHFANKTELLAEILHRRDTISRLRVVEGNTTETLDGIIDLVRYNSTVRGLVSLHTVLSAEASSVDHPAHGYFQRRYDTTIDMLTRFFEQARREGKTPADIDPSLEARSLVALMDGLQVQWLLKPEDTDMVAAVESHLRKVVFLSGTAGPTEPAG